MSDPKQELRNSELIRACHFGQIDVVKQALRHGADLHCRQEQPLRVAILAGHKAVAQLLIHLGARASIAEVAVGYAADHKEADVRRLFAMVDGGRFGGVAKKLRLKTKRGVVFNARQFVDGSVLGAKEDFLGNVKPFVVDMSVVERA